MRLRLSLICVTVIRANINSHQLASTRKKLRPIHDLEWKWESLQ